CPALSRNGHGGLQGFRARPRPLLQTRILPEPGKPAERRGSQPISRLT
ncbi:MAG: hypothetical protein AVDCRST_MAG31-583, partial [uncultured Sphingomonas sp.]